MTRWLIGIFAVLAMFLWSLPLTIGGPGLTADMLLVGLHSVGVRNGATQKLLDRRTGQWMDVRLDQFSVHVHGDHFVIEGNAHIVGVDR